ncbi:MAG TPA: hypothetical protein PLS29_07135 [Acidimicrobiales bacterium]|nr:MAG: hypothetical protein B7Z69_09655 [Actinobacteria bacterium 21-73-9]HQU26788.1 hypothetical protein [Acidimicrobiales bacterium]
MTSFGHHRYSRHVLDRLVEGATTPDASLGAAERDAFGGRLAAVPTLERRRVDAWLVERGATTPSAFAWSPARARRALGRGALRRLTADPSRTPLAAVTEEVLDHLARAATGYVGSGTLAAYLAAVDDATRALCAAEAVTWATQTGEAAATLSHPWAIPPADPYYDVPGARTTLRGQRDLVVSAGAGRVLVRVRAGAPGRSAGAGLRVDLLVDALADASGAPPARVVGLWPEAGVALSVDGTLEDLRAGARAVVRALVVGRRRALQPA